MLDLMEEQICERADAAGRDPRMTSDIAGPLSRLRELRKVDRSGRRALHAIAATSVMERLGLEFAAAQGSMALYAGHAGHA